MMIMSFCVSGRVVSSVMPAASTMPNIITPAPPMTGAGMIAITMASFGTNPATTRNSAPMVTTKRLMTPVKATSPTFCENDVFGSALKSAASEVPRPSPVRPPFISRVVGSRWSPALVSAEMSPTVSIDVATAIAPIAMRAALGNSRPKCSGCGAASHGASATRSQSSIPSDAVSR